MSGFGAFAKPKPKRKTKKRRKPSETEEASAEAPPPTASRKSKRHRGGVKKPYRQPSQAQVSPSASVVCESDFETQDRHLNLFASDSQVRMREMGGAGGTEGGVQSKTRARAETTWR